MDELWHPLLKVPYERANKSFRLMHKHVTREVSTMHKTMGSLLVVEDEDATETHTTSCVTIEEAIKRLDAMAEQIRSVQKETKRLMAEQHNDMDLCVQRTQYVREQQQQQQQTGDSGIETAASLRHDRLVADYLVCSGLLQSSKLIQDGKDIARLVDHDVHGECRAILNDLDARVVTTAITWCAENGSRLRRLQSQLEFQLRLQEFLELVRAVKTLEAIQYMQTQLTPIWMQHEDEQAKKSMMDAIQEAMATLALTTPDQCGVDKYSRLFAAERWTMLKTMFRTTFCEVYGIHNPPSLWIALYAGVSSLNTRVCKRTRDARDEANNNQQQGTDGNTSDKRDGTDNKRHNESNSPKRAKKSKLISISGITKTDSSPSRKEAAKQRSKNGTRGEGDDHRARSAVPLCPTCSEIGSKLVVGLPFAHHAHSRLICRLTEKPMDEHNRPLALPNGQVYSQEAIDRLTMQSLATTKTGVDCSDSTATSHGLITCPETHEIYSISELRPVFIL